MAQIGCAREPTPTPQQQELPTGAELAHVVDEALAADQVRRRGEASND